MTKDEEAFVSGAISGAFAVGLVVIFSVAFGLGTHDVGSDHRACMTIADTEQRRVRACLTGEELMQHLRKREGIK